MLLEKFVQHSPLCPCLLHCQSDLSAVSGQCCNIRHHLSHSRCLDTFKFIFTIGYQSNEFLSSFCVTDLVMDWKIQQ